MARRRRLTRRPGGAAEALGQVGDFYLSPRAHTLYGPKRRGGCGDERKSGIPAHLVDVQLLQRVGRHPRGVRHYVNIAYSAGAALLPCVYEIINQANPFEFSTSTAWATLLEASGSISLISAGLMTLTLGTPLAIAPNTRREE